MAEILMIFLLVNNVPCTVGAFDDGNTVIVSSSGIEVWGTNCGRQPSDDELRAFVDSPEYQNELESRRVAACDARKRRLWREVVAVRESTEGYDPLVLAADIPTPEVAAQARANIVRHEQWLTSIFDAIEALPTAAECQGYTVAIPPLPALEASR